MINIENITAGLNAVSSAAKEIELVPSQKVIQISKIRLNPNNTASRHDTDIEISELAESIRTGGLIHPLTVSETDDGEYILLSGERRYKAITQYLNWPTVPCTVYSELSEDMISAITVIANMQTREYTTADRLELYEQLKTALTNLKADGKYSGGVGRGIAKIMQVSERQISAYKQICDNVPKLQRQNITNINAVVKDIRKQKTYAERKFSEQSEQEKIKKYVKDIKNKLSKLIELADDEADNLTTALDSISAFEERLDSNGEVR